MAKYVMNPEFLMDVAKVLQAVFGEQPVKFALVISDDDGKVAMLSSVPQPELANMLKDALAHQGKWQEDDTLNVRFNVTH